jgi:hypothetical protein
MASEGMTLEPWEANPEIWKSKTAFFTYLRGGLRLLWSKYPAKLSWKKAQMSPPPEGYKGRGKSFGKCHYCAEMFVASHLEVDHVKQAGECSSWETAYIFLHNLLDCNGNWVLACKPCHKVKSYAERMGTTFKEAQREKRVIEFLKRPKKEVLAFCLKNGYNDGMLRNEAGRRAALSAIFEKELE